MAYRSIMFRVYSSTLVVALVLNVVVASAINITFYATSVLAC